MQTKRTYNHWLIMVHGEYKYCVPDLQKERDNCPFDKEEVTNFIDGGKDKTNLRRKLGKSYVLVL